MGKPSGNITICLADDHPVFRKGLVDIIGEQPGLTVIGETGDGLGVMPLLREKRPDVLLLDLNLPGEDGLAVAQQAIAADLGVRIVVLTMHNEEAMFNRAMDIGVNGYVLKESAVRDIVESIRAVTRGEYYISPSISGYLVRRTRERKAMLESHPGLESLTPAERRVLAMVASNKSSREIGDALFISVRTVENHRQNISTKLGLRGSNNLLKFAIENRSRL